jgi:hypothetical protein
MAGLVGPQARELPVSSCVSNPDTFHLSTTRDSHQSDQPCILHIPGINGIIRIEKNCTDLHQNIAFAIYLPSPAYYYYPISAKDLKRIPAKFRPGQDSNQERATRLTPTRVLH